MKHLFSLSISVGLLLSALTLTANGQVTNSNNEEGIVKINAERSRYDCVPGQVLLKFKDSKAVQLRRSGKKIVSTSVNRLTDVLQKYGVDEMEQLLPQLKGTTFKARRSSAYNGETVVESNLAQLYLLKLDSEHSMQAQQLVEELQLLDDVEYAEPNYLLHTLDDAIINATYSDNPYVASQWYLDDYGVKELWSKPIINKTRPVIAIIDTGVDMTHPDLKDNLWVNIGEDQGERDYDNDNNGFANDVHGWDFINDTGNVRDYNMHGTHVAGIAAASNNGIGIVGANPKALIMPVTVMQSDGTGDVATIIKGINYAVDNGATVLNLSLGTYANSRALRQALEKAYQTAVIVAAAGNDGLAITKNCNPFFYGTMFPAGYSFVLGVQATTNTGGLAGFSNYDCDGPNYSFESTLQDPDGFNYEIKAPGTNMLSTIPGGKYKVLQGTSMAAPLVAGAVSALKMVKQYDTQEILWGDLLHTDNIAQAYRIARRPAELDLVKMMYRERKELSEETEEDYSGDGRIDAGETVELYPVLRTTFGEASNIKIRLEMGDEFEDQSAVQILTGTVDFGLHLDAYGKAVALNPLKLRVADGVAHGRHIKMKLVATCDETDMEYHEEFGLVVDNTVKIGGFMNGNITLTADKEYFVYTSIAIAKGDTLTIEPGTKITFATNTSISSSGKLNIHGTPEKPIIMTNAVGQGRWAGIISDKDTISYCKLNHLTKGQAYLDRYGKWAVTKDCYIDDVYSDYLVNELNMVNTTLTNSFGSYDMILNSNRVGGYPYTFKNVNFVNNDSQYTGHNEPFTLPDVDIIKSSNYFNTGKYTIGYDARTPQVYSFEEMPYLGSGKEEIVRKYFYEMGNGNTFSWIDLDNLKIVPNAEAHGIVWKVLVNGKDVQDEYEDLAPLGVGYHKFEVCFNRPMNKAVAPNISFGVRDPWTQNAVSDDGHWNEEGTVYTAYKTINGKTKSDGINRIYVWGAQDNEFFEAPYEKNRFNFRISAAGSMATGFAAEAGLGRVNLAWNNEENNFEDAMGFNIYRFDPNVKKTIPRHYENGQLVAETQVPDTIRINKEIVDIETTSFTDYDVTPGVTYYYQYKVLSTDLKEYDVSNIVAATPLTASKGDANGDTEVDVNDVVSTVNYVVGEEPKPFVFEAADMNSDQQIDVLDVIGIVQTILNPAGARLMAEAKENTAVYTIENGTLYVETPVALAGLQLQVATTESVVPATTDSMEGFEQASAWLTESDYLLLAYSFGRKTLLPGKHAIMQMGNAELTTLRLSDQQGRRVRAVAGEATCINDAMGSRVMTTNGVYNMNGQKVAGSATTNKQLKGVFIIDGKKVVK